MYENTKLIKQFEHYDLLFLIPEHMTTDDSEEEGIGHAFERDFDPMEEEYYDDYFDGDADFEEEYEAEEGESDGSMRNLDALLNLFDCDYMSYSEFLNTNIWDLFGITKKQFDLIDWSQIPADCFEDFLTSFKKENTECSIEQRIKYSIVNALTDYTILYPNRYLKKADYLKYANRLIDGHSIEQCKETFGLLRDYYRFYPDALVMNERRGNGGEEKFKYVLTPKIAHLRDLHDKAFRDHRTLETERLAEDREHLNKKIRTISKSTDYKQYLYENDTYKVLPVTCQEDLDYEGNELQHCVASYGSFMSTGKSYIYFIRKKEDLTKPYFTVEIVPGEKPEDAYKFNQCYTYKDSIDKPESLKEFIVNWASAKKFKIRCKI